MDEALHRTLRDWRRHLHRAPELSGQEAATASFVCARLQEMGIPFEAGIGGHGVVATLARPGSNRSVGLRADMDALPIAEATGLAYASETPDVMHACGHDGHTASLLGAARLLRDDPDWRGTVRLVFQPAEEGLGGARAMVADGLLTRFPMERIFGYHNWPGLPAGTVMVHDGPVMAQGARVAITLTGKGGHAAQPHLTRDPMVAAAHLLVALQTVVARGVDPQRAAVLSICTIEGGLAANQIPQSARLTGTFRTYLPEVHASVEAGLRRITEGVCLAFEMRHEVAIRHGMGPVVNPPAEAALARAAAAAAGLALRTDLLPSMAGEDFARYQQDITGAFAWIGNGEDGPGLHHPAYDFNDAILPAASGWLAEVARGALAGS